MKLKTHTASIWNSIYFRTKFLVCCCHFAMICAVCLEKTTSFFWLNNERNEFCYEGCQTGKLQWILLGSEGLICEPLSWRHHHNLCNWRQQLFKHHAGFTFPLPVCAGGFLVIMNCSLHMCGDSCNRRVTVLQNG